MKKFIALPLCSARTTLLYNKHHRAGCHPIKTTRFSETDGGRQSKSNQLVFIFVPSHSEIGGGTRGKDSIEAFQFQCKCTPTSANKNLSAPKLSALALAIVRKFFILFLGAFDVT
ncbi:MAG: hypothetical protein ABI623_07370 [bacterium]